MTAPDPLEEEMVELTKMVDSLSETLDGINRELAPYRQAKEMLRMEAIETHETEPGILGLCVRRWTRGDRSGIFASLDRLALVWRPTLMRRRNVAAELSSARKASQRVYKLIRKRKAKAVMKKQQEMWI